MRILIIEDEEKIVSFMRTGLRLENFIVDAAYDGDEALEKFEKGKYDLVLLDLMMPKKDGFETCVSLKKIDKDLPIIMISARDSSPVLQRAHEVGVSDYIIKPFRLDDLIAKVKQFEKVDKN